jgi:hypothetical protein
MRCLKVAAENDRKFYTESLHKVYVVNCPKIISYAWSIVKLWPDERTQQTIFFYKDHETKAKLLEDIDADNLPVDLGVLVVRLGTVSSAGCCGHPAPEAGAVEQGRAATRTSGDMLHRLNLSPQARRFVVKNICRRGARCRYCTSRCSL